MSKSNKTKFYIDSNHFTVSPNVDIASLFAKFNTVDPIRINSNICTTIENNQYVAKDLTSVKPAVLLEESNGVVTIKADKKYFSEKIIDKDGLKQERFSTARWEKYIQDVISVGLNYTYKDFSFEAPILKEIKETNGDLSRDFPYVNREFIYNFHSPLYENVISNPLNDVNWFPSVISVFNDPYLDTKTLEENVRLSLGGIVPQNLVDTLILSKNNNNDVTDYFETFAELLGTQDGLLALSDIKNFKNHILIDNKKINDLNTISYIPFPFYMDLRFTNFAKDNNKFINSIQSIGKTKQNLIEYLKNNYKNFSNTTFIEKDSNDNFQVLKNYDLKQWLEIFNNEKNYNSLEYSHLLKNIINILKPHKRSYNSLAKQPSYSEIIMYRLEKRQFSNPNAEPIQVFWLIPNDKNIIRFIDSQIKYGSEYFYTLVSYNLVVGNEYKYSKYNYNSVDYENDIINGFYRVNVENNTSYKIFEIPLVTINGSIQEEPLTKPYVTFSKNNKDIKIKIENSSFQEYEKFNIIENIDYNKLKKVLISQENETNDKIRSKNYIGVKKDLQIYKIDYMPQDYLSFQGKLYKTINIEENTTFSDNIIVGVEYYYLFRYINNHGIPSNTSDIYRVQLKNEEGYTYLDVKKFDINRKLEKKTTKSMKKYLLVRPSIIQTQIEPYEDNFVLDDIRIGPQLERVWNKDFVLRLTSTKSNRVLEFNLKTKIITKKE